jgi:hypothetical protein
MALRTGNKRAYLMGEGNAHDRYGLHTVRVNKRPHACPKCVGFLGRLLIDDVYGGGSRAEATAMGIPTLSDAIGAGFLHPNCKDMYSVYIPGISRPAQPWTQEEISDIVGEYNQEQEIRHAEDMRDTYQRMAKYSLDPENQATYQQRADNWQARVDELSDEPPQPAPTPVVEQVIEMVAETEPTTATSEFVPAKTKAEAEQYAKKFAENANYSGVSLANANIINEQLNVLTSKYPINKLNEISTGGKGVMNANYHRLGINGKKLGKVLNDEAVNFELNKAMNKSSIKMLKDRWAGKKMPFAIESDIKKLEDKIKFERWGVHSMYEDHVKCVVTHEYGHILSDQYFGMINAERANPNYAYSAPGNDRLREMNRRWDDALKKARDTGDIYKISQYANTKPSEFFAECFALREMGGKLPDYVESLMKEVLDNGIM